MTESLRRMTPREALDELLAGNDRFVRGARVRTLATSEDPGLRAALVAEQRPLAAILGCCDSRVSENLLFDQELGRLFSVRTAAGTLNDSGLASLEFAVRILETPLILVIGHSHCGALQAVVEAGASALPGHLAHLQRELAPTMCLFPRGAQERLADHVVRLAEAHARRQVQALLRQSPFLREGCRQGRLRVIPALYHLETGKVAIPNRVSMLQAFMSSRDRRKVVGFP